jgi:hypothetical protein
VYLVAYWEEVKMVGEKVVVGKMVVAKKEE